MNVLLQDGFMLTRPWTRQHGRRDLRDEIGGVVVYSLNQRQLDLLGTDSWYFDRFELPKIHSVGRSVGRSRQLR